MGKTKSKPIMPKEFAWILEIDGEEKIWKCVVGETECVTYDGDAEGEHLKIENPQRKEKLLQIDTVTSVYGQPTQFQLENGIPYIRREGHWLMSDTTRTDRLHSTVQMRRRNFLLECIAGLIFLAAGATKQLLTGCLGFWWVAYALAAFCFTCAGAGMVRLKRKLKTIGDFE